MFNAKDSMFGGPVRLATGVCGWESRSPSTHHALPDGYNWIPQGGCSSLANRGVTQVQFSGSEKLRTIENKSQVPHKIAINEEVKG
jgi:hypothetical protein